MIIYNTGKSNKVKEYADHEKSCAVWIRDFQIERECTKSLIIKLILVGENCMKRKSERMVMCKCGYLKRGRWE